MSAEFQFISSRTPFHFLAHYTSKKYPIADGFSVEPNWKALEDAIFEFSILFVINNNKNICFMQLIKYSILPQ
jgi:hypothetical protein